MNTSKTHSDSFNEEGILAVDRSFRIMSSNGAAERLLAIALHPGDPFQPAGIWPEPLANRITDLLRQTLQTGASHPQVLLPLANAELVGTIQPLFERPESVIGAIMSFQVASHRRSALYHDARRAKSEGVLQHLQNQNLFEALPEGVFTINTHWYIESFNHRAEEITGYQREEVIGRHCWEIFRSDLCQLGCPLRTALESGLTSMDQDVRILKKGGKRQTILVNAGVLRTATGKIRGAVETFRPLAGEAYFNGLEGENVAFAKIIGAAKPMQRIFEMLPDIAASDANVLITGESGTGKDLIARTIHDLSSRADKPYVAVNCSALAETLLESELFGHEKSAFTGATGTKIGRFELAKGGTLFLDEIGELRPELQIKLLRVLENHEFERVGGARTLPMEARIISATNKDLRQALRGGLFREDFYYRLRTVPLAIPPLRERVEDVPLLVEFFLKRFNQRYKKRVMSVHPEVMQMFMQYAWPGNVRELERTLEHAYVFVKGPIIMPANLPAAEEFQGNTISAASSAPGQINRQAIDWALLRANGNRLEAARMLGLSRTTLWRHMKQLGIV
ncbi:MAG: PAS domain-containing protein [Desulfobacteraceae bacterium]|nr:MAG: PAS domain-containing protein [Desulfobacteraceae bacterium]